MDRKREANLTVNALLRYRTGRIIMISMKPFKRASEDQSRCDELE